MRRPALAASALLLALALAAAAEVPDSAETVAPLEVGAHAPDATLRDVDGRPVPLGAYLGKGPVALVFYRGGW